MAPCTAWHHPSLLLSRARTRVPCARLVLREPTSEQPPIRRHAFQEKAAGAGGGNNAGGAGGLGGVGAQGGGAGVLRVPDIVVNIQGDEPLIVPAHIDAVVSDSC